VELCRAMQYEGLTPTRAQLVEAREAFRERAGLFVMIRPREGGFSYSKRERAEMKQQIKLASAIGADGVVWGVLRESDSRLCVESLQELMDASRAYPLKVGFHRAFDATPDPVATLEQLIESGVDRILTSGTPWGAQEPATRGIDRLKHLCEVAGNRIEIVVAGGVDSGNVAAILHALPLATSRVAVHAYSGAHEEGTTTEDAVRALVRAVQGVRAQCDVNPCVDKES